MRHYGQAGHFVAADDCRFHLHTHCGPRGRWCVSTIGEYYPAASQPADGPPHAVGFERLYETRVFDTSSRTRRWVERDGIGYNDRGAANRGHAAMVATWDTRTTVAP